MNRRVYRSTFALIAALATIPLVPITAQQPASARLVAGFQAREMVVMGRTWKYQLFVPAHYTSMRRWPVVLALHGDGERGDDNQRQLTVGVGRDVTANAASFPAVVVFPQLPLTSPFPSLPPNVLYDSIYATALALTLQEVRADSARVYMVGISNGACRGWDLIYRHPERYAAFIAVSGTIQPAWVSDSGPMPLPEAFARAAARLKTKPIHTYHGSEDAILSVTLDRKIAAAFAAAGATAFHYTEYPGVAHGAAWDRALAEEATWRWLFAQHQ